MNLPANYQWLNDVDVPPILKEAIHLYGTVEYKGHEDSPVILGWAKEIGSNAGMVYDHDEIPWCGLFVAVCAFRAKLPLPAIAVRASSWDSFGTGAGKLRLGDVLRFQRPGGGHVGFYVGEDAECFHVLGGNQSDAVTITRIDKDRLVAARRCWPLTSATVPIHLEEKGDPFGKPSENEA